MKKLLTPFLLGLALAAAPALAEDVIWYRTAFLVSCMKGQTLTGVPMIVGRYKINDYIFERYFPLAGDTCPNRIEFID